MSDEKPKKIREHGRPDLTPGDMASGVAHEAKYFAVSPDGHLVSLEDRQPMQAGFRLAVREDLELALARADAANSPASPIDRAGYVAVRDALLSLGWRPQAHEVPPPPAEHHEEPPLPA